MGQNQCLFLVERIRVARPAVKNRRAKLDSKPKRLRIKVQGAVAVMTLPTRLSFAENLSSLRRK